MVTFPVSPLLLTLLFLYFGSEVFLLYCRTECNCIVSDYQAFHKNSCFLRTSLKNTCQSTLTYTCLSYLPFAKVPHVEVPCTEAEFMNVQVRGGLIISVLRLEVSVYNVFITTQFQTTFAQGGGGSKSVRRGDYE
jgi:hypothetical protein